MENLLYRNAKYFKENILPFTFLLKGKKTIFIVKSSEQDFAHLVGKQYSKNLDIHSLQNKDFLEKALQKDITYDNLLDFNDNYSKERNWIMNKNECFVELFESFISKTQLKLYKKTSQEAYRNVDMDYYHQMGTQNISILSLIGNFKEDSFIFNSILSNNRELDKRFGLGKPIFISKNYKILNKNVEEKLKEFNLPAEKSPRNSLSHKQIKLHKKQLIDKQTINKTNQILSRTSFSLSYGRNGKGSIQVYKDKQMLEGRYQVNIDCKKEDVSKILAQMVIDTYGTN